MNAATGQLNSLHKDYLKCVNEKMSEFLSKPSTRKDATEFCQDEKKAYFMHMKSEFPHQYKNILRIDENTY